VLRVMRATPRHQFVPADVRALAYADRPVPIGHAATISQPYIVARMTELLGAARHHKVLEIGTGSGYQAAVLAQLVRHVWSIELVPELARNAAETLRRLGYDNVTVRAGDGYKGWPEEAPFDRIIVTAAPPEMPPALVEQLARGGRLVAPVGRGWDQELIVLEKGTDGRLRRSSEGGVIFVPMRPGTK
jgi:protein-L-isoaspartate(D-aspartate) O-methyltransferase